MLRSFGGVPDAPVEFGPFNSVVHHQLTQGGMLCLEDRGLIILMRGLEPDVYAHNMEGELVWQVQLADFRPIAFQTTGRSLTSRIDHLAGVHVGKTLTRWDDRHLLVQLEMRRDEPRPDERDFHALESRLISIDNGKEVARTDQLPLIGAVRGNMIYGVENRPFPRVFVMRRTQVSENVLRGLDSVPNDGVLVWAPVPASLVALEAGNRASRDLGEVRCIVPDGGRLKPEATG
jgi:hypothetical protein